MFELDKIKYASVKPEPFQHVEINGLFPIQRYRRSLQLFPTPEEMYSKNATDTRLSIVSEHVDDTQNIDSKLKGNKLKFWVEFRKVFYTGDFVDELKKLFDITESVRAYGDLNITTARSHGESFKDVSNSLLTAVIYLDNTSHDKGINFFDSDGNTVHTLEHYPNKMLIWKTNNGDYESYQHQTESNFLRYITLSLQSEIRSTENVSSDSSTGGLTTDSEEEPVVAINEATDSLHD